MATALVVALTLLVAVLIAVPSWRLGRRLGTPPSQRTATPEEREANRRERAARRKAELAALTRGERVLFYAYYAISITIMPAGILLTICGYGATRTVGIALLIAALVLMAVPVGPILGGRTRRRKRSGAA